MGSLHARAIAEAESAELAAIVDIDKAAASRAAEAYGSRYLPNVEAALERTDIDAYVVALPDRSHRDVTVALLEAGRAVLLEKPMAHTLEAARAIAEAAERGGGRLLVGHILRFDPRYVTAAAAVRDGAIGELLHASAGRIGTRSYGRRLQGASSVLFYVGVHDVDAIQWVSGGTIRRVYARAVSKLMQSQAIEGEDAVLSLVDFDGGGIGHLFSGWTRADNDPVAIDGRLEIFGTNGRVEVDARDHGVRVFDGASLLFPDGLHWPIVNNRLQGDLTAEITHFTRAVLDDRPFVISVIEAMQAVAVNDAILRSLASGQPEEVDRP